MKKTMMDAWTKQHTRVIDQRSRRLPPTWVLRDGAGDGETERKANPVTAAPARASRKRTRDGAPEQGRAVHVSGRDRTVAKRIVKLLATAQRMAVVSSFLLADREVEDAILEAAQRGVRVYVLLASEARLDHEPGDGEFEQRVLAEHKTVLQRLGGYVLIRSAPHFHAKLVLVDACDRPAGLLLTANLTREALERNEELAVELTPKDVAEAAEVVRWALWENAEHELVEPGNFRAVKPLGCIDHPAPAPHVLATTASVTQLREETVEIIDGASREFVVASFGWDAGHPVVEHLCERARQGLSLTVLARVRPRAMPALVALAKAGARVLGFKWLHAKALWADSGRALVMSANLEKHGLDEGFELGLRLDGERAEELRMRLERWSGQAAWELRPAPALGELAGAVRVWHDRELVELDVKPRRPVDLGIFTAASAETLTAPKEPEAPRTDGLPHPDHAAHDLECRWLVQPPRLNPKAKEVKRPITPLQRAIDAGVIRVVESKTKEVTPPAAGRRAKRTPEPPVFKEPGGRQVVAVQSPEEIPSARRIMAEVGAAAIVVRTEPGAR